MELFEVAAGNWCVAGTAVFRISDLVSPILYLGFCISDLVSRIDKRISQWQFVVLSNTMTSDWSLNVCCGKFYPFLVCSVSLQYCGLWFKSNIEPTWTNWFISDQVWWSFQLKTLCCTIVDVKPTWDIYSCFSCPLTHPFSDKTRKSSDVCPRRSWLVRWSWWFGDIVNIAKDGRYHSDRISDKALGDNKIFLLSGLR